MVYFVKTNHGNSYDGGPPPPPDAAVFMADRAVEGSPGIVFLFSFLLGLWEKSKEKKKFELYIVEYIVLG